MYLRNTLSLLGVHDIWTNFGLFCDSWQCILYIDEDTERYSFGHRFYYWPVYKHNDQKDYGPNTGYEKCDWYIGRKYKSLQAELLLNKISRLTKSGWDNANAKAKKIVTSDIARKSLSDNSDLSEYCKIKPGTAIDEEHILSVILYCDYSELSFNFGTTFRYNHDDEYEEDETDDQLKARNSEYWHWFVNFVCIFMYFHVFV